MTHTVAEVATSTGIDHQRLLTWIRQGHITSLAARGKNAKHALATDEATIAELMGMLTESGLDTEHAATAARGMVLAGPKAQPHLDGRPGYALTADRLRRFADRARGTRS